MVLLIKNLPANAGDTRDVGSIPGFRRSPGVGNGNPLQHSCLEHPMNRGAWRAPVHGVAKEWDASEHAHTGHADTPVPSAFAQPGPRTRRLHLHSLCPCWLRALAWAGPGSRTPHVLRSSSQPSQSTATSSTPGSGALPPCCSFSSCHPGCRPGKALSSPTAV